MAGGHPAIDRGRFLVFIDIQSTADAHSIAGSVFVDGGFRVFSGDLQMVMPNRAAHAAGCGIAVGIGGGGFSGTIDFEFIVAHHHAAGGV